MGSYAHYYWFATGQDCFKDTLSGNDACVEGNYEKRDVKADMGTQYFEAIYYGVQDGLQEMADSPESLIKEAALGAALGMGLTIGAPISGTVGMAGIIFSIQSFYQSYQELRDMEDNYARLREVARMVTISVVESIASGAIIKAGKTVKEAVAEVALLVKDTKVWQSACDWLKRNVTNIADVAGGAFKSTVNAILAKVRSSKDLVIYKYISQKADDIYAELKGILDADAINYVQRVFYNKNVNTHISDFRLLVDTAECIKTAREELGRNVEINEVQYILKSLLNKVSSVKIIKFLVGGRNSREYSIDCRTHLYEGKIGRKQKGVLGGHNLETFLKVFKDSGFDLNDCILNVEAHPSIKGIYEIEYRIPLKNGKGEIIPNQYKKIKQPKTVYDPAVFSDEQIYELGKEALDSGKIFGREIHGCAHNGLKFMGYFDGEKQEITSFFPVLV